MCAGLLGPAQLNHGYFMCVRLRWKVAESNSCHAMCPKKMPLHSGNNMMNNLGAYAAFASNAKCARCLQLMVVLSCLECADPVCAVNNATARLLAGVTVRGTLAKHRTLLVL